MSNNNRYMDMDGITFFGAVSAAVTHDMKNFLAIINENAGLLGDLAVNAQNRSLPIDPQKAGQISEKIRNQVARADTMIKQFNRFSHSMDHAEETVDVEEMVHLVAGLAARIIRHHGVCLTVTPATVPCRLTTHRFGLLNLIFRAVEIACTILDNGAADTQKQIMVGFGMDPKVPEICFTLNPVPAPGWDALFDQPKDRDLLDHVNMVMKKNNAGNGFCLCRIQPDHA
jgi:signal transduction histidine kinase